MNKNGRLKNLSVAMLSSFAALCSMQAFAGEGNGQGHNGPTLSPISVPGAEERGVAVDVVQAAIRVCLAEGATDRGVSSLLQKLGEQAFAVPFKTGTHGLGMQGSGKMKGGAGSLQSTQFESSELMDAAADLGPHVVKLNRVTVDLIRIIGRPLAGSKKALGYEALDHAVAYDPKGAFLLGATSLGEISGAEFTGENAQAYIRTPLYTALALPKGAFLPRVVYSSKESFYASFDWLKNPTSTSYYLKGLALETPDISQVKLINTRSGIETSVSIDLGGYADCLKNEIQREAGA